jgi:lipoprotein-anchoring transpeptidase ErfK/SrfK
LNFENENLDGGGDVGGGVGSGMVAGGGSVGSGGAGGGLGGSVGSATGDMVGGDAGDGSNAVGSATGGGGGGLAGADIADTAPITPIATGVVSGDDSTTGTTTGTTPVSSGLGSATTGVGSTPTAGEPPKKKGKHKTLIGVLVAVLVVLGLAAGFALYYFHSHAYFGTQIMGSDVSGKSVSEVAAVINEKTKNISIALDYKDSVYPETLADMGIKIDAEKEAQKFIDAQKPSFNMVMANDKKEWTIAPEVDKFAVSKFLDTKFEDVIDEPVNASVAYNETKDEFVVTSGEDGDKIDPDPVYEAIEQVVANPSLSPIKVSLEQAKVGPLITNKAADEAKDILDKWTSEPTKFDVDGETVYTADKGALAFMLDEIPDEHEGVINISLNRESVEKYVTGTLIPAINRDPVPSVIITNRENKDTGFIEQGSKGYKISESADTLTANLYDFLKGGSPATVDVKASVTNNKETRVQRYVHIMLGKYRLELVENGKVIHSFSMYSGAPETPTITGTFQVWYKTPMQTMTGYNIDGTKYIAPDVPWVSYFSGDYAFHGTPYADAIGNRNQSHGCVNLLVDQAKIAYDFAPIGTEVQVDP